MAQTVLVTGGAGFIGSEIVRLLHEKTDYGIRVLDSLTEQIRGLCCFRGLVGGLW
ncbi:NAD-dependent epimerase/dehydratase family protein [Bifidobacterium reuteri]|uniref:NAD-dependent epimerase/dehydratase family protein n=1 Tax=Bifidobacterium reuteri TaxID=983706 RepID=A0A5J5DZ64_9BIFI|nr:NAD-dependent epimerase/dehydratase family protein [Bifidobacterium reuteri]KAA8821829.1 NAD-dependent epimerase/dehydratase family protein [Bifidobacterium reuteri]